MYILLLTYLFISGYFFLLDNTCYTMSLYFSNNIHLSMSYSLYVFLNMYLSTSPLICMYPRIYYRYHRNNNNNNNTTSTTM